MVDQRYWIWYQMLFGYGSQRSHLFLEQEPCPQTFYEKLQQKEVPQDELSPQEWNMWKKSMEQAKRIQAITEKKRCSMITPDHPEYPPLLQEIYAKPLVLYVKGSLSSLQDNLGVAVVGARNYTEYGEKVTDFLVTGLAHVGTTILSGLALGIDSIALSTAAREGSSAIGVLACGLDYDYPKGNAPLKRAICEKGAVMTEYPMGTKPHPQMFPPRNRVLAGMSHGVLVVEASSTSGSLITAHHGIEYDRDVFVPPNSIFSGSFTGSHQLLREGAAKLVTTPQDILEEYHFTLRDLPVNQDSKKENRSLPKQKPALPEGMDDVIQKVYEIMNEERKTTDDFARMTQIPIAHVMGALTTLEILGLAKSYPGGYFALS